MRVRLLAPLAFLGALGALIAALVGPRAGAQLSTEPDMTEPEAVETVAAPPAPQPQRVVGWKSRELGISVVHPAGWPLLAGEGASCFTLAGDGVEVRAVERFRAAGRVPRRARVVSARGRTVLLTVFASPGASPEALAAAARVQRSLALARSGRCRPPATAEIRWRPSRPLGLPHAGRLAGGVQLPAEGRHFFTWDPVLRRTPDRPGRRWGTAGVVRATLAVVDAFAEAHPKAPRVGIGDLSLRRGGPFGPKHASHQNGLDVDVYYPRKDRRERPPATVAQVDRRLAQDLVDRFVAAGATKVFVGPNLGLTGPRGVVVPLWNHDNHLHARFPPGRA